MRGKRGPARNCCPGTFLTTRCHPRGRKGPVCAGREGRHSDLQRLLWFLRGRPTEETGWEGARCEASPGFRISPVENSPGKKQNKTQKHQRIFLKAYHLWQNHSCDLELEENELASLQGCADQALLMLSRNHIPSLLLCRRAGLLCSSAQVKCIEKKQERGKAPLSVSF